MLSNYLNSNSQEALPALSSEGIDQKTHNYPCISTRRQFRYAPENLLLSLNRFSHQNDESKKKQLN